MHVALVDLLTMSPFYDCHLAEALAPLVDDLTLYAITYHLDRSYWSALPCKRSTGALDIVSKLGIKESSVRRTLKTAEYIANWSALCARWQWKRPDILHVQWLPLLSRTALELEFVSRAQRLGIPLVYTMHNLLPHDLAPAASKIKARYATLYRMADALIVHTEADKEHLVNDFDLPVSKVFEIKQGAVLHDRPFAGDRSQARRELGWEDAWFTFLALGIIRPYKGIEEALHAMVFLVRQEPRARLVVAGQGDANYVSSLLKLATGLGISSHVIWELGFVPTLQVPVYYAASDIALFPYRAISQSGALLTAAGLGSCVLAANVGGLAEVIRDGETGLLWASQDPADLAERMRFAMRLDPLTRDQLGARVRRLVLEEHAWGQIGAQTLRAYEWARMRKEEQASMPD
jgi:glycosyltransferase involved in cell wall biosynthesis